MNKDEIAIIKKTWEGPKSAPEASGSAILIKFFTRYPANLKYFSAFNETPVPELRSNPRFMRHCTRIINTFNDSIDLLEDPDCTAKITEIWSTIGKTHVKRSIKKPSYVELRECILEVLVEKCKLNDQQTAVWTKFVDYALNIIYTTMDQLEKGGQ